MRTVFNNRDVAKVWANQSQPEGRGHNLWFEGPTIFSYGRHFPIASYVDSPNAGRVILYTTADYSITTARHKSYVWSALHQRSMNTFIRARGETEVFHVPHVDSSSPAGHLRTIENAKDYLDRIAELTAKQKRARKVNREYYSEQIEALKAEYRRFCEAFGVAFELLTAA